MKKVIAICSTDWHIDEKSLGVIPGLISQKIELAKKLNSSTLVCLGDVFESRKAQKESVLNTFKDILDMIEENNMVLYLIPGNHDKTDYTSPSSFLDPFSSHPALKLITEPTIIPLNGVNCAFIPFFQEDVWVQKYSEINSKYDILFSHIAMNGSFNNNKTKVESSISPSLFKDKEVFLGHYHNYQDLTPSIHHIPSIKQKDFGEDLNKGFTVLYANKSYDIHNSKFKPFVNVSLNVDDPDLKNKLNSLTYEDAYVKVKLTGSRSDLKSLDLSSFRACGLRIDLIADEVVNNITTDLDVSSSDSIIEHFETFCKERDLDLKIGIEYLNHGIL